MIKKQDNILMVSGVIIFLMVMFPPYFQSGYGSIFYPPLIDPINYIRLSVQIGIVAVVSIPTWLVVRRY